VQEVVKLEFCLFWQSANMEDRCHALKPTLDQKQNIKYQSTPNLLVIHFNIIIPFSKSSKWPPFNRSPYWNSIHISCPTWDDDMAHCHCPHFTTHVTFTDKASMHCRLRSFENFPDIHLLKCRKHAPVVVSPCAMRCQISSGCNKATSYVPHSFFWTLI